MRKQFSLFVLILFLILINLTLFVQFRQQLRVADQAKRELQIGHDEISSNFNLLQEAWATSFISLPSADLKMQLPDNGDKGYFAVRLTEYQCSSCIDYTLFQLNKNLKDVDPERLLVLYTSGNEKQIKQDFRMRLMKGARFIRIPENKEITPLDTYNIPYLLVLDSQGQVLSSFLSFPASEKYIGLYLHHTLESLNKKYEDD